MSQLTVIEHKNQRVLTTQQIAEAYETDTIKIRQNFQNNKSHYVLGKHYYILEGDELTAFKNKVENFDLLKHARHISLWTEKGALLHAKSLNTDKAWEVYDHLVETYFKARDMFTAPKTYVEALEAALSLAKQLEEQKPKVLFAEKCLKSGDSILIRELAKVAAGNGIEIGEHRLYKKLREWGLINGHNEPYQEYIDREYFEVLERAYSTYDGVKLSFTTKVLPKGQAYILNRLAG